MNSNEPAQVDQALFGYSDGHRQIAASVRLPSKDQYQLAAATDLAAGARLNPDDNYLTGLPLGESRRFALIRDLARSRNGATGMCLEPRHTDRLPTTFLSRRPFGFPGNAEPPREGSHVVLRRATDAASTRAPSGLP